MDTQGIWSPDDTTEFDPAIDLAAMALSIATRIAAKASPVGSLVPFAGVAAPAGWLLCQGQAVSRTTYEDLFEVLSTRYGTGDGSTTFNVPNLKGRTVVGVDSAQTEFTPLAKTGGAKTHKLTDAEMPKHRHNLTSGIVMPSPASGSVAANAQGGSTFGFHYLTGPAAAGIAEAGSDASHNNLQPYLALNYIIKT